MVMICHWLMVAVGLVLTVGTGFFVASEFALVNLDRNDLEGRERAGEARLASDNPGLAGDLDALRGSGLLSPVSAHRSPAVVLSRTTRPAVTSSSLAFCPALARPARGRYSGEWFEAGAGFPADAPPPTAKLVAVAEALPQARVFAFLGGRPGEEPLAVWMVVLFAVTQASKGLGANAADTLSSSGSGWSRFH